MSTYGMIGTHMTFVDSYTSTQHLYDST